jgi:hypothetical protein
MEDNYLDKKLKDILENPPHFEPDAAAISDMKKRLDKSDVKSHQGISRLWWLVPLLLLPFLLGGVFFLNKYQELNQKLDRLNLQLSYFQRDTTHENHITYYYDTIHNTIYKDVIIERRFEKAIIPPPSLKAFYRPYSNNSNLSEVTSLTDFLVYRNGQNLGTKGLNLANLSGLSSLDNPLSKEELLAELIRNERIDKIGLKVINYYSRFENIEDKLNDPNWEPTIHKANPILYFVPKGGNIGGNYTPIVAGKANSKGYSGKSFGINGSLEFYGGIEMSLGLERLSFGFEVKEPEQFAIYPLLPPDNTNDLLTELKPSFSYLHIPLMFKKYIRKDDKLRPFFGVGFVAQKPLKQNFVYEYVDDVTDQEYKLNQSFKNGDFTINNLRTSIGLNYHFLDHFSAQTEFVYYYAFDQAPTEYFKLRYWGANIGLRYHLN